MSQQRGTHTGGRGHSSAAVTVLAFIGCSRGNTGTGPRDRIGHQRVWIGQGHTVCGASAAGIRRPAYLRRGLRRQRHEDEGDETPDSSEGHFLWRPPIRSEDIRSVICEAGRQLTANRRWPVMPYVYVRRQM